MKETKNIMIVGVGGQGTLLTSRILGGITVAAGYDVQLSEVHGMAQRGGSVVTFVRYGEKVYSPIIDKGEADFIISFEKLEAARYAQFLKTDGKIIVNAQEIEPMPVITGAMQYPHEVLENLSAKGVAIDEVDALDLALKAGTSKAVNIVLMGRLSKLMPIEKEKWVEAIKQTVAPKFVEMNLKAFELGRGE